MPKSFFTSTFSLGFRGLGLAAKFVLTIFIGKYFNTYDLGIYGLFITSVTFFSLIIGLDYYNFSNRNLISSKEEEKIGVLKEQFFLYFCSYILFLPILLVIGDYFLPSPHLFYFVVIVILDHFSQELFRITISLEKSVPANFFLFLRSGSWVIIIIALFYFGIVDYKLEYLWLLWITFSSLTIVLNLFYLSRIIDTANFKVPITFKYVKAGVNTTLLFFISTISYKIVEISDRYLIDLFMSKEEVGVYTFYSQIVNLSNVVITTSVIFISFPQLVKSIHNKEIDLFKKVRYSIAKRVIIISSLICAALFLFSKIGFKYINEDFLVYINSFYILNLSSLALNFSLISHYSLYAMQQEKYLLYTSVACAVTNIILNLLLINSYGLIGASVATFASYMLVLILKYLVDRRKIRSITTNVYA